MTALIVILSIALLIALLLSTKVLLHIRYEESLTVYLRVLFVKIRLYPSEKEKKKYPHSMSKRKAQRIKDSLKKKAKGRAKEEKEKEIKGKGAKGSPRSYFDTLDNNKLCKKLSAAFRGLCAYSLIKASYSGSRRGRRRHGNSLRRADSSRKSAFSHARRYQDLQAPAAR